jgi:anti-sigma B factor antagonist
MNITEKKNSKTAVSIAIEGEIIINFLTELKNLLSGYVKVVKNMEIDLSSVNKIDTAGYQLLIMLKKEVESNKKSFSIINPSDEIKRIYNLYGEVV